MLVTSANELVITEQVSQNLLLKKFADGSNVAVMFFLLSVFFFFKQKTAYEIASCLVGSEMCIRDSYGLPGYLIHPYKTKDLLCSHP